MPFKIITFPNKGKIKSFPNQKNPWVVGRPELQEILNDILQAEGNDIRKSWKYTEEWRPSKMINIWAIITDF